MFESAIIFCQDLVAMTFGVGIVASLAIGLSTILLTIGLICAAQEFITGRTAKINGSD